MAKRPIDHKKSAYVNKQIDETLKIKKMSTDVYETKKEGIKEIFKVTLVNPADGFTVVLKGDKSTHHMRDWDKRMLNTKESIHMTLSIPTVRQKNITDKFGGKEEEEETE